MIIPPKRAPSAAGCLLSDWHPEAIFDARIPSGDRGHPQFPAGQPWPLLSARESPGRSLRAGCRQQCTKTFPLTTTFSRSGPSTLIDNKGCGRSRLLHGSIFLQWCYRNVSVSGLTSPHDNCSELYFHPSNIYCNQIHLIWSFMFPCRGQSRQCTAPRYHWSHLTSQTKTITVNTPEPVHTDCKVWENAFKLNYFQGKNSLCL